MTGRRGRQVHGVLVVDKPEGWTSHDVVGHVRRILHTRRVGHAGTLDPMATGVLVVLVGEATKLSQALTTQSKEYVADVLFGIGTDSLDADGKIVARREVPEGGLSPEALQVALAQERARELQAPPAVSAIKIGGKKAYDLARRGVEVELLPRDVRVHELRLESQSSTSARVRLRVSKGYYVRALARDLGAALGYPAHLTSLRRLQSGSFGLEGAVKLPLDTAPALTPLLPTAQAHLTTVGVTEEGASRLGQGKVVLEEHLTGPVPEAAVLAAITTEQLVALVEHDARTGGLRVRRGINDPARARPLLDQSDHG